MLTAVQIVSTHSVARLAFANDGTVAWLRQAGGALVSVDPRTGAVLRELHLSPAPFGMAWRVERHAGAFVVRDDHELAAYDALTGVRLWKRRWPTHVAFAGERDGRHVSVIPGAHGEGVEVALADLATGAFESKLRVPGSMQYVGAHGTLAGDRLFFATDERDVFTVDVARWEVVERHHLGGGHVLPPIVTTAGVHVASVERRESGSVTQVALLDAVTGSLLSTHEMAGAAHLLAVGPGGVVLLETRRGAEAPVERVTYRPDAPHLRLTLTKHVDLRLVRSDLPRPAPLRVIGAERAATHPEVSVQPARIVDDVARRRDELLPTPRDGSTSAPASANEGLLGLLALLDAGSDVLARLARVYDGAGVVARIGALGVRLRDPRARWSSAPGRDPCLLELAENRDGDAIATYLYPSGRSGRVPVVLVSRATGEARWLADDLDVWFSGVLHNASAYAPDGVRAVLRDLALPDDFPRPLDHVIPPSWFFEAHSTTWTMEDAVTALADGDLEGAERMLVAVGRMARGHAGRMADAKDRLGSVYAALGWAHHRATVVETW